MLISSYNNKGLKDVLVVITAQSKVENQTFERKDNVSRIESNGEIVGWNFFEASNILPSLENGPVILSEEQVDKLNQAIAMVGFNDSLKSDSEPKIVVGFVKECSPHEDSDHLNVTQTEVDNEEVLQIVCGASNVAQGQKVVVAKPGSILPDGLVIWPGELRGVKSSGMICSAKELGLDPEKKQKGIMTLDDSYQVGQAFKG